ncbi:MAG: hypothetical protein SPL35_03085 [Bacteroidales bacterium]|nr:hypothetical protein [Bacteroidales bacterium]
MYAFKSWLVANIEVILIVFTVLLSIACFLFFPKTEKSGTAVTALIIFSIVLCVIIVACVRNGIAALFVIALLVGAIFLENKKRATVNPSTETEVVEQQTLTPEQEEFNNTMDDILNNIKWSSFIWLGIIACIFGIGTAVYACINFDDVVSRRFLYRNSTVSVFEEQWKYTFNRFYAGFMTFSAIALDFMVLSACLKAI